MSCESNIYVRIQRSDLSRNFAHQWFRRLTEDFQARIRLISETLVPMLSFSFGYLIDVLFINKSVHWRRVHGGSVLCQAKPPLAKSRLNGAYVSIAFNDVNHDNLYACTGASRCPQRTKEWFLTRLWHRRHVWQRITFAWSARHRGSTHEDRATSNAANTQCKLTIPYKSDYQP